MEVNPLSIILVKYDSKGDRLLFRYPYEADSASDINDHRNGKRNPYALSVIEDLLQTPTPQTSNIRKGQLTGFTDEVLSTLFAVKPDLCNRKFELKINDVRFVSHPTRLPFRANKDDGTSSMILINIVFALQALASHSVVKCYYDLSRRLGKALRYEEKRCAFLSEEMKIMISIHDELSSLDNDIEDNPESYRSPFQSILQRSSLAKSLKTVFEELSSNGIVQVRINDWTLVSFCLPHKAHQFHNRGLIIDPETIDRCLRSLRPYHGLLLLIDPNELLDSIPLDSNPSLIRLITQNNPLKSLQTLAVETDMPIQQIFQLTGHLVYWAKATIIYPLCESNVYVIAPDAQVHLNSALVEKFAEDFPGLCLIQVMSKLSLPAPLWYPAHNWAGGAALFSKCVVWMLQRHLLLQLHTYIQFLPTVDGPPRNGTKDYYCEKHKKHVGPRQALSDSLNSLNHIPHTSATTPSSENSGDESLVLCGVDNTEWMFPTNIDIDYSPIKLDKNDVPKINGKVNESDKNRIDNPKNVFRESNLIFGSITPGSSTDSQSVLTASSENDSSVDNVDDIIKFNNNEHDKLQSNGIKHMVNGNKNLSSDKSDFVNNAELTNNLSNNNLKNTLLNKNVKTDILNNENDVKVVVNGFHNLKIEDNVVVNGKDLNEKEKTHLTLNTSNSSSGSNLSEKKFNNKYLETTLQLNSTSNVSHYNMCDVVDGLNKNSNASINNSTGEPFNEESLLAEFTEEEKLALLEIPAAHNPEDLHLLATLYKKGYFKGGQHIEEIMFMENLPRSQVLQLLDKFRNVLITYETEDPAIAMLYSNM